MLQLSTVSKRKIKQFSKPLITKGLRILIQTKNRLHQPDDFEKYKYYRKKIYASLALLIITVVNSDTGVLLFPELCLLGRTKYKEIMLNHNG